MTGLDTASKWKAYAGVTRQMYDVLMLDNKPTTLDALRTDPNWTALFRVFLTSELSGESLEFLDAVDEFKRLYPNGDEDAARVIYQRFVREGSERQINVPYTMRVETDAAFAPPATPDEVDVFDICYGEVHQLLADPWRRFTANVEAMQDEPVPYEESPAAEVAAPPAPKVTPAEADAWNQSALKALGEGKSTDFWEIGKDPFVIVIEAKGKSNPPRYLTWAREHEPAQGTITLTEKGSIFQKDNPGKITIDAADDEEGVTRAIRRISRKGVVHT